MDSVCSFCQGRGNAFYIGNQYYPACPKCGGVNLMDIQDHEKQRCVRAGKAGGAYLDSIQKYDLRALSQAEWNQFIECVCMDYCIPF